MMIRCHTKHQILSIISIETIELIIFAMFFSCNVECQDTCATSSWTEWSTCKPRHCNENYREEDRVGIGYQKPSIPGKLKCIPAWAAGKIGDFNIIVIIWELRLLWIILISKYVRLYK